MNLLIREVVPEEDAAAMIAYVQELAAEPGIDILIGPGEFNLTVEEEQRILADFAAAENSIFLLAEVEGQIVGVLNCRGGRRRAARHAVTLGISVRRGWRDRGIGRALMERAVDWARGTGIVTRIELAVFARNERAIHLYKKFGFEEEGLCRKAVFREGHYHDNLIMALLLD